MAAATEAEQRAVEQEVAVGAGAASEPVEMHISSIVCAGVASEQEEKDAVDAVAGAASAGAADGVANEAGGTDGVANEAGGAACETISDRIRRLRVERQALAAQKKQLSKVIRLASRRKARMTAAARTGLEANVSLC